MTSVITAPDIPVPLSSMITTESARGNARWMATWSAPPAKLLSTRSATVVAKS